LHFLLGKTGWSKLINKTTFSAARKRLFSLKNPPNLAGSEPMHQPVWDCPGSASLFREGLIEPD
jgi:hypothetical protein